MRSKKTDESQDTRTDARTQNRKHYSNTNANLHEPKVLAFNVGQSTPRTALLQCLRNPEQESPVADSAVVARARCSPLSRRKKEKETGGGGEVCQSTKPNTRKQYTNNKQNKQANSTKQKKSKFASKCPIVHTYVSANGINIYVHIRVRYLRSAEQTLETGFIEVRLRHKNETLNGDENLAGGYLVTHRYMLHTLQVIGLDRRTSEKAKENIHKNTNTKANTNRLHISTHIVSYI